MALAPSGEMQVKGLAFRTVLECLQDLRGSEAVERALEQLPSELRDALRYRAVVPGGWYSVAWYRALLAAIADSTGEGPALIREIGRTAPEKDLNGVYRTLLKLLSPATIFKLYAALFSKYYSAGELDVEHASERQLRVRVSQCRGFDSNMWVEIFGSARRLLELSGAKNVQMRIAAGGTDHDDYVVIEGSWS